jgi:hypothetical protein
MLVMERLRGVPLTDLAAIRRVTSADPEGVLINALNVWFGSVLACETFHADMHAGLPHLRHSPVCHFRCTSWRVSYLCMSSGDNQALSRQC